MKSDEALAFEADRLRMRLEFRILAKNMLNQMEDELAQIHRNANARGVIPSVVLEPIDQARATESVIKLIGTLQIEA